MRSEFTGRTRRLPTRLLLAAGLALLLAACGSSNQLNPGYPVLTVSATNSGGKFSSYLVAVDAVTLTQQNGGIVAMVPSAQVVDLAKLSEISELVSAYSVPYGTYVSATITLDYVSTAVSCVVTTGAHCVSVNINGKAVPANFVAPSNGAIGQATVTVTFDPAKPLVVALQQSTAVHLNFDLQAFNTIDYSTATPTVLVQPYVTMSPSVLESTPVRARGLFVTVKDGYAVMNLRPFYSYGTQLGAVIIKPAADAYYNINGVVYTGAAGLAAMSSLLESTVVVVYGTLGSLTGPTTETMTNPTFNATEIYAGIAQENGLSSLVGMISARSGNTLTLRGALLNYYDGSQLFYPGASVTVDSTTPVAEDGVNVPGLSIQSLSVGQYLSVSGTAPLTASCSTSYTECLEYDAAGNLLFGATGSLGGYARMLHTRLWGTLAAATPTSATFDLLSLGLYAPVGYNFAGTGSSTPADPAAYLVNTGTTDLSGTAANTLVAIDGSVTPFGAAPPDFAATALTPGSNIEQTLVVEWPSGEAAPFLSASSGGYVLNLAKSTIGVLHDIFTGPAGIDLKSLPASPLVTTTGANQSNLQLSVGKATLTTGISMFATPTAYYTQVHTTFNGTNKIYRFVAAGHYNSVSNTFVAERINMALLE